MKRGADGLDSRTGLTLDSDPWAGDRLTLGPLGDISLLGDHRRGVLEGRHGLTVGGQLVAIRRRIGMGGMARHDLFPDDGGGWREGLWDGERFGSLNRMMTGVEGALLSGGQAFARITGEELFSEGFGRSATRHIDI